jgi:23S rRNA pseudouridine2457 synthase
MVIAYHKPYGVLCQFTPDRPGQRTLADFQLPRGVYPLGRLDMDSEGLLLLSDEAGLNHRLLDPAAGHERTYWAQVEGVPGQDAIARLARGGLEIRGHRTLPCRVRLLEPAPDLPPRDPPIRYRAAIPTSWMEIVLVEGKNRQVRRMTAAVGFPTLRLFRAAIRSIRWHGLDQGCWRTLDKEEMQSLRGL